jgi:cytochrome P450
MPGPADARIITPPALPLPQDLNSSPEHLEAFLCQLPSLDDPYPIYAALLHEFGPVLTAASDRHYLLGYKACETVLRSRGFETAPRDGEQGPDMSFLRMNGDDHQRLRRVVGPMFTPRKIARYALQCVNLVNDILDGLATDDPFDAIALVAEPVASFTLAEIVGIPYHMRPQFSDHLRRLGPALDGSVAMADVADVMSIFPALQDMISELQTTKKDRGHGDLLDIVAEAVEAGAVRSDEALPLCMLIAVSGVETTKNLVGNTLMSLTDRPACLAAVLEEPQLAAAAVDETLRYDPPVHWVLRICAAPTCVEGVNIDPGATVIALIPCAHRDNSVFVDAESYILTRAHNASHLAFAAGLHHCIGGSLARIEAIAIVETILRRFATFEEASAPRRRSGAIVRGIDSWLVKCSPLSVRTDG